MSIVGLSRRERRVVWVLFLAVAAQLVACGDGNGAEVGPPQRSSNQMASTMEPGAKKLELENVRKPVEVKESNSNWTYTFEVTGAQTSVNGRFGVADPGQTYVKVFVKVANLVADRPAPLSDDATPGVALGKRLAAQESCSSQSYYQARNGQFCLERNLGQRPFPYNSSSRDSRSPNDSEEYYKIGGTWKFASAFVGQIPPGGTGEILIEGGPYPEPLQGRDFYVFLSMRDGSEIPLAGG